MLQGHILKYIEIYINIYNIVKNVKQIYQKGKIKYIGVNPV